MSKDPDQPPAYDVGFGKPPLAHRFPPGRSGNVRGRPKKQVGDPGDLAQVLDEPVTVRERGQRKRMSPKEVATRTQIRKGLAGDRKAAIRVLDQFAVHGALPAAAARAASPGAAALSIARMPFAMAMIMAQRFGAKARYREAQLRIGRAIYVSTCSNTQAAIDAAIGYPDLKEGDAP